MKKKILVIAIAVVLAAVIALVSTMAGFGYFAYLSVRTTVTAPESESDHSIVIMSANIRRQEKILSTDKADIGTHRWYRRAQYYLMNIDSEKPDILGAQEVQERQYKFLVNHLKGYGSVVTYRDDKGTRSESCPIFYSEARFDLLGSGTYWLSEDPDHMSRSWGAKEYRITTYVILLDTDTDQVIAVFNAHPEWKVDEGRDEELQVLAAKVGEMMTKTITVAGSTRAVDQVILLGDLNTYKEEPNGAGIAALSPIENLLADSKDLASAAGIENAYYGYTFNNYGTINSEDPQAGLDYIYLPKDATVLALGKVDMMYGKDGNIYPSDHFPIYAKVKLN